MPVRPGRTCRRQYPEFGREPAIGGHLWKDACPAWVCERPGKATEAPAARGFLPFLRQDRDPPDRVRLCVWKWVFEEAEDGRVACEFGGGKSWAGALHRWRIISGCPRKPMVPLRLEEMRAELDCFFRCYNGSRPNMVLQGRTPHEVYLDREPANEKPRYEPRRRYPLDAWCASPQTKVMGRRGVKLRLDVSCFEGRRHLPVVGIRPAA